MSVAVDTSGRTYHDFSRLLFLHAHREASSLNNELSEESSGSISLHSHCWFSKSQGLSQVDFCESIGHEDFYTARFVISDFYTTTTLHSFQTSHTTFCPFPRPFSFALGLSGT
jgi:hypothetical protein